MKRFWLISSFVVLLAAVSYAELAAAVKDDGWVDMTDMLRYDPMTKTMRPKSIRPHASELIKPEVFAEVTNSCSNPQREKGHCERDKTKCPGGMSTTTTTSPPSQQPSVDQCESDKNKCPDGMATTMTVSADSSGEQPSSDQCDSAFIVRHVRRLLRLLNIASGSNYEDLSWDARITLTKEDIDVLRLYATSKGSLQNLDRVLTGMMSEFDVVRRPNWIEDVKEKLIMDEWINFLQENLFLVGLLIWFLMMMRSMSTSGACGLVVKLAIQLLLLSTGWEWKQLYQEAEAAKRSDQSKFAEIPMECNPGSMTYWQTFVSYLRGGDDRCHRYYATIMTDSLWKVTPLQAFASALGKTIPTFGGNLGDALGLFFSKFMNSFGFIERYFMALLALLVMAAFVMAAVHGFFTRPQIQAPLPRAMVEDVTNDNANRQVKATAEPTSPSVIQQHFHHYYSTGNSTVEKWNDIRKESPEKPQATQPPPFMLNCPHCKSCYDVTPQELQPEPEEIVNLNATGQGDSAESS